jgi:ankyrin repeat protein
VELTREEVLVKLDEIEFWPELKLQFQHYLDSSINQKDVVFLEALLKAGADPNPADNLNCYLHHLLHEYQVEKTTNGALVLSIMESLLKHGANPNRVWSNNLRAYDYAVSWGISPVAEMLEKYGADKNLREAI